MYLFGKYGLTTTVVFIEKVVVDKITAKIDFFNKYNIDNLINN